MLHVDKVIKPWRESAALNAHINLFGFWNETAFLTKERDLGMVLSVPGVDYESLDRSETGVCGQAVGGSAEII
jgi:type IV secretion system protein VirB4